VELAIYRMTVVAMSHWFHPVTGSYSPLLLALIINTHFNSHAISLLISGDYTIIIETIQNGSALCNFNLNENKQSGLPAQPLTLNFNIGAGLKNNDVLHVFATHFNVSNNASSTYL
jgi:hypothetical protein